MRILLATLGLCVPWVASATQVTLLGVMGSKAIVSIDGGRQQILSPGQQTPEGVRLIAVGKTDASFDIDGRPKRLGLGDAAFHSGDEVAAAPRRMGGSATIVADSAGRFVAPLKINGFDTEAVVDFKSSLVTLNAKEAKRLGIDVRVGNRVLASKTGSVVSVVKVRIKQLRIGGITLENLDAIVNEGEHPPVILLGNNVLSRLDVRRDGKALQLSKPY